ncbi:MAG TPA: hypothetical protein VNL14_10965 [Candidatus Acidoferrales bacterium]|nr:hypothetical protein [Candidatus Acidoferrales bacterium]
MTEPDVALTDYALSIECALFAAILYFRGDRSLPSWRWFILFFASLSLATFAGGTVHGLFLEGDPSAHRALAALGLVSGGLAALAAWGLGAALRLSAAAARLVVTFATGEFFLYCALVLFVVPDLSLALANYAVPAVFLALVFHSLYRHMKVRELRLGTAGLLLTLLAAAGQQKGIALGPPRLDPNAVYHALQAVALLMVFLAARWLLRRRAGGLF